MAKFIKTVDVGEIAIRELRKYDSYIKTVELKDTQLDGRKTDNKVHWWDRVHVWLNGKKTYFGLGIVASAIALILFKVPGATLATATGAVTTIWGIGHKIFKSDKLGSRGEIKLDKDNFILLIKETLEILKRWINLMRSLKNGK